MIGRTILTISIFENLCHTARTCRHMQLPASLPTGNFDVSCVRDLQEGLRCGGRHIVDSHRFLVCLRPCNTTYSVRHAHNLDVLK